MDITIFVNFPWRLGITDKSTRRVKIIGDAVFCVSNVIGSNISTSSCGSSVSIFEQCAYNAVTDWCDITTCIGYLNRCFHIIDVILQTKAVIAVHFQRKDVLRLCHIGGNAVFNSVILIEIGVGYQVLHLTVIIGIVGLSILGSLSQLTNINLT